MPGKSVLTGAAGEDFVLYRLHQMGVLAAQSPKGAFGADIVVFDPEMNAGSMIQVKTRTYGADQGWHMSLKHETLIHPRLFYAFVDLQPSLPIVYIVPSQIVADVLMKAHRAWLEIPGKDGRKHQDTEMRRLRPAYQFQVPGYPDRWIDPYRERWDSLRH